MTAFHPTELRARRVQRNVPVWDIVASGNGNWTDGIGVLTHLPAERAWCATVRYRGREIDLRAATREAVLLALRCAVDAADHAWNAELAQWQADMRDSFADEDYIEDEDGEMARMRYEERRAEEAYLRMHGADMDPEW